MKKTLVVGSLNMDLVTQVKATPKVGETILGNDFNKIPGGKGANQAVTIGKLGGDVTILGCMGNDEFGKILQNNLQSNGVDCSLLKKIENNDTGIAFIMLNESGDNSIVVIPGANYDLTPTDIDEDIFKNYEIVLAQLETPLETIETAFKLAKQAGCYTVLNPAPAQDLSEALIKSVDLLIPNETEFESITGENAIDGQSVIKGAKYLFELGITDILITLGGDGARYMNKSGENIHFKGYKVDVVDTTAAGDSFIGGLIYGISLGESIKEAIDRAMVVGAITVTRLGAQSSLPSMEDVKKFKGA